MLSPGTNKARVVPQKIGLRPPGRSANALPCSSPVMFRGPTQSGMTLLAGTILITVGWPPPSARRVPPISALLREKSSAPPRTVSDMWKKQLDTNRLGRVVRVPGHRLHWESIL